MKDTGIVRQLDELGRLVIPKELRKEMKLKGKDGMRIFIENGTIILKPNRVACFICGEQEEQLLATVAGYKLCSGCIERALQMLPELPIVSHKEA